MYGPNWMLLQPEVVHRRDGGRRGRGLAELEHLLGPRSEEERTNPSSSSWGVEPIILVLVILVLIRILIVLVLIVLVLVLIILVLVMLVLIRVLIILVLVLVLVLIILVLVILVLIRILIVPIPVLVLIVLVILVLVILVILGLPAKLHGTSAQGRHSTSPVCALLSTQHHRLLRQWLGHCGIKPQAPPSPTHTSSPRTPEAPPRNSHHTGRLPALLPPQ